MARVLLTGMSGAGKSTLLAAVARRGHPSIDTDYDGWELPGTLWDEPRMSTLLAEHTTIAVSGTAQNQGRFYDRFEHVIYLRVPLEILLHRVRVRGPPASECSSSIGRMPPNSPIGSTRNGSTALRVSDRR